METEDIRKHFSRRAAALKQKRWGYESTWRDLAELLLPQYLRYLGWSNNGIDGNVSFDAILNNTPKKAVNTYVSGLMSTSTSPSKPWYAVGLGDRDANDVQENRVWLDVVTRRMLDVMIRSNYYNAVPTAYMEDAVFGTGAIFYDEDEESIWHCYNLTPGEYWLGQDARGNLNTCYREFKLTVQQTITKFGEENVSEFILRKAKDGKVDEQVDIAHVIEPGDGELPTDSMLPSWRGGRAAYRSVYYELKGSSDNRGGKKGQPVLRKDGHGFLEASGYFEFPVAAARSRTIGNEVYGIGLGHEVLGDLRQLQSDALMYEQAKENQVNPPLQAPASMQGSPLDRMNGGVTYYPDNASRKGIDSLYDFVVNLQQFGLDIENIERRIWTGFYADVFQKLQNQRRRDLTAREVDMLEEEKFAELAEIVHRYDTGFHDPTVERLYGMSDRRGIFPEAPEGIQGAELKVEYISILHKAQKAQSLTGIDRLVGFASNYVAASGDRRAFDKLDIYDLMDRYGDGAGAPPSSLIATDEAIATAQQRAQQEQAAQGMQMAQAGADTAKTLAETPSDGDNLLKNLMSGAGAG